MLSVVRWRYGSAFSHQRRLPADLDIFSLSLRDRTYCITVMGEQTHADVVSMRVTEGDRIDIEGLSLDVLYTPGHTDDSYSYLLDERVFTGDTLLIRGTGRTDFQNGNARAQCDSIFNKLLKLPNGCSKHSSV
jgi:sulfur dioxygenase